MRHDLQAESKIKKKIEKKRCSARRRNETVDIADSSIFDDIRTCHGYSSWALAVFQQAPGLNRLSRRMCSFFLPPPFFSLFFLSFRSFSFSLSECCHGHLGSFIIVIMISLHKKSHHCDLTPFSPAYMYCTESDSPPLILALGLGSFMLWHERNEMHSTDD